MSIKSNAHFRKEHIIFSLNTGQKPLYEKTALGFLQNTYYVGHLSMNDTTLWNVFIKISNKKFDEILSKC